MHSVCGSRRRDDSIGQRQFSRLTQILAAIIGWLRQCLGRYSGLMAVHPLDNPVWTALTTTQARWAQASALARRFPVEIGPLAGFAAPTQEAYESLGELFPARGIAAICLDEPPELPSTWTLHEIAPMLQMIYTDSNLPLPASD